MILHLLTATFLSASAAQADVPDTSEKKDKLICKRQSAVGSLVRAKRVCLTKADWAKAYAAGRKAAEGAVNSCQLAGEGGVCTEPTKGM
jgi:hypothetical protein